MPFATDFSPEEAAALNGTPLAPKGNAFIDMPKMLAAGTVDLVGGTAALATRGAGAALQSPAVTSFADDLNRNTFETSQAIRDSVSPRQKQANEASLGEAWDDGNVIRKVAGIAAESLPTFLPAAKISKGIGALAGLGERVAGVAGKATKARIAGEETARVLGSEAGLTEAEAAKFGADAAESYVPKELSNLQKLGVFGTGEAAVTALTTPEQTRYELNQKPMAEWAKSPEFQKALAENNGDKEAARRQVINQASAWSASQAAGTLAGSILAAPFGAGGGVLARVLNKNMQKSGVMHSTVEGLKEEFTQEFFQSGLEQAVGNQVTKKFVDPSTDALNGVLEQAILGGAAGGLSGGLLGAVSGARGGPRHETPQAPSDTETETPPGDVGGGTGTGGGAGGSGYDAANTALAAQLKAQNIPAAETAGSFEQFKQLYAKNLGVSADAIPAAELNAAFEHHIQSAYDTNVGAAKTAGLAVEPHTGTLPDFPAEQPGKVAKEQSFTSPDGNSFRVERLAPTPEKRGEAADLTDHVLTLGDAKSSVNPEAVNAIKRVIRDLGVVAEVTSPLGTSTGPIKVGFKSVEDAHLAHSKLATMGKTAGMQYASSPPTGRGVEAERIAAATPVGDKGAMRVPILQQKVGGHMAESVVVSATRFAQMKRAAGLSNEDAGKNKAAFDKLEAARQEKIITPAKLEEAMDKTAPEGVPPHKSKALLAAVAEIMRAGDTVEAVDAYLQSHTDISTPTREGLTNYKSNREKEIKNGQDAVPNASKETPRPEPEKGSPAPRNEKAGDANANDEKRQAGDVKSFAEAPRPAQKPRFKTQAEAEAWRKEQATIAKLSAEEAPKVKPIAGVTDKTPAKPAPKEEKPKLATKQERAKAVREAQAALRSPQSDKQLLLDARATLELTKSGPAYIDAIAALFELSEGVNVDPKARALAKSMLEPKDVIGNEAIPRGKDWDAARRQWEKIQKAVQKAKGILGELTQAERELAKAAKPIRRARTKKATDVTNQYKKDGTLKKKFQSAVPTKETPAAAPTGKVADITQARKGPSNVWPVSKYLGAKMVPKMLSGHDLITPAEWNETREAVAEALAQGRVTKQQVQEVLNDHPHLIDKNDRINQEEADSVAEMLEDLLAGKDVARQSKTNKGDAANENYKPELKDTLEAKVDPRIQEARAALGAILEKRENGEYVSREELLAVPKLAETAGFNEGRRKFLKGASALALWGAINPTNAFATNTKLADVIKTGDLKASLQWVADNSTSTKYRMLARVLGKLVPNGALLKTYDDPGGAQYGYTRALRTERTVTIMLNSAADTNGMNESTLLHEAVHAAIMARYDLINYYAANMSKLGPHNADQQIKDYVQLWQDFRAMAKEEAGKKDAPLWLKEPYRDPDEFITYALTHSEFQDWMRNREIGGDKKSLWDKFVDFVRSMLGLDTGPKTSWLEAAMTASNNLLTQAEKDSPDFSTSTKLVTAAAAEQDLQTMLAHAANPVTPNEGLTSASDAMTQGIKKLNDTIKGVASGAINQSISGHKLLLYWSSRKNIVKMFRDWLPALNSYSDIKDKSAAYANKLQLESQQLYSAYDKWMRAAGRKLTDVSDGVKRLTTNELFLKTMADITVLRINPRIGLEQQKLYKANGDNKEVEAAYEKVMKQWKALSPSGGQKILKDMLEMNEARTNETYDALVRNLLALYADSSGLDTGPKVPLATVEGWLRDGRAGQEAVAIFKKLNTSFKAMEGTYFHVGRFGNFAMTYIDADGERVVTRYETAAQLQEAVAEVKKNGWDKNLDKEGKPAFKQGSLEEALPQQYKQVYEVVKALSKKLDNHPGLGDEQKTALRSAIRDMYVDMMPELSVERVMVQRKGTGGYRESEMARSWAKRMVTFNNQLSRVKYTVQIGDQIDEMRAAVKELESGTDTERALKASAILAEIRHREANEYSPNTLPWVSSVNALSHNFYLGLSPGYLLTNLLQPIQLTLPYLGSRHGFAASAKELYKVLPTVGKIVKAMAQHDATNPFLDLVVEGPNANYAKYGLTQGQAQMVRAAIDFGRIDGTFYHHINAVASGSTGTGHRISTAIGVGAHYSEIINRLATGLAAYNLELARQEKEGRSSPELAAEQYAIDAIDETQYDYSTSNKGRALGTHGILGAATPLLMQFQSYSAQTLELLARTARASFIKTQRQDGETDAEYEKRSKEIMSQSRKQFAGVLVTTGALAGTMGLPFASAIFALVNALGSTDDDPIDAKKAYQQWLADVFGNDTAETLAHGVPRLAGIDLARSGLQDLLPFSRFFADRRKWQDKIDDLAVNNMGPAFGMLGLGARALDADNAGLPGAKVIEALAPNAIKGAYKAYEAATDGDFARDARGNKIPVQLNSWDEFQMILGFTPAKLAQQRESQYIQNTNEQLLGRRATALRTTARSAIERGDAEALSEALAAVSKYNEQNPASRITMQSLWQGYYRQQRAFNVGLTGPGNLPASPRDIARGKITGFDYTKKDQ